MELYLKDISAPTFAEAERFAREKAAGWFGEDARCLDVKPSGLGLYDQDKDLAIQSFMVRVQHKIDNPSYGFPPICRYCRQRVDREGRRV